MGINVIRAYWQLVTGTRPQDVQARRNTYQAAQDAVPGTDLTRAITQALGRI